MSANIQERIFLSDKIDLAVKVATTYLRKSGNALYWTTKDRTTRIRPISSWYWALLNQALDTANDIVKELPDDFFEDRPLGDPLGINDELGLSSNERFNLSDEPLEKAEKVVAALQARRKRTVVLRKIHALENTDGRTEEEAKVYRAKADELRQTLEG